MIVEVGGTVGDIEGQPFLEAIRQIRREDGRDDTLSIHVTFLPHVGATGELKTKPTQHSVRELRSDRHPARRHPLPRRPRGHREIREKIALFCDVADDAVIPAETDCTIYEVPIVLEEAGLGDYVIASSRSATARRSRISASWRRDGRAAQGARAASVEIAVVGKYVELHDAYLCVKEALIHAGGRTASTSTSAGCTPRRCERRRSTAGSTACDGILVPGRLRRTRHRGQDRGGALRAREPDPVPGLCLGLQMRVIEFARNVAGSTARTRPRSTRHRHPVIDLMPEQRGSKTRAARCASGATRPALVPGTKAAAATAPRSSNATATATSSTTSTARRSEAAGLIAAAPRPTARSSRSSRSSTTRSWSSQFHPEFSRPDRPQPLFREFIAAALAGVEGREPVFSAAPQPAAPAEVPTEGSTVGA